MPDIDLPQEVADALEEHEVVEAERLAAIGDALAKKRKEAVDARKNSGIETVWFKAEEAYLGIDDANRASFAEAKWAKPSTMEAPLTRGIAVSGNGSTAFVRLTSRYVDAGTAKMDEILLPAGEKAFSFTADPVPELVAKMKDSTPANIDGRPLERTGPDGQTVPITVKEVAEEAIEAANKPAKAAERRIYDWMVQSRFRAEARKVVFDGARIGVGVLKGPFPRKKVIRAWDSDTKSVKVLKKAQPAYEWVDPWNIFPDPACGENIHDGDHIFHCDPFSRKQLRNLKGQKDSGYIDDAIDKVLKEGPDGSKPGADKPGEPLAKNRFLVWYYYGTMRRSEMVALNTDIGAEGDDDVYAIVTMVNDTIIRASVNPLDSGEFPYHSVPWQRRAGYWAGVGVGEQIEMPQAAINAAIRSLFNNAGKSAGSVIVADRGAITPADGNWVITPDKLFYKNADATADDVRKAFAFFQVPNMGPQLMAIIELCLRLAEETSQIPLITQGQSGPTTPDTFGAAQLQNNNANQLLRSIGYSFDDYITEPVVLQSYEMLLLDPDVPTEEKGSWQIAAHGSIALVERAIQDQTVQAMGQFATDPVFGVNPKRWFAEFARTKHLDPKSFQYSDEEQAKIDSQPKPSAPAIEVAKIKSADAQKAMGLEQALAQAQAQLEQALEKAGNDTKLQIAAIRKEVDTARIMKDTDRDVAFVNAQTQQTQVEREARLEELRLRERLAILDYANKKELKLEEVKTKLADTSMKLQVQKELSALGHQVSLRMHDTPDVPPDAITPATEPAGRAADGKAFTQ